VDYAPTVCAISVGSILNATCDKSALKDKMSVDKHIGSIGHCLFIHSANCTETAQRVDSLRSFVLQIWHEAWKTRTCSPQFCSRYDSRLEPSTSPNCAVLEMPKILCRQQKTLFSASFRSLLVDDANLSNYED
jgi:hypothetical protein